MSNKYKENEGNADEIHHELAHPWQTGCCPDVCTATSPSEDREKGRVSHSTGEDLRQYNHCERQCQDLWKTRIDLPFGSGIPVLGI